MIPYIEFEHYRIFNEKQRLRIAPLTIVFGKNNTGKSAVLKLPMLLHSAVMCDEENVFFKTMDGVALCNEYRDIVYGKGNHVVRLNTCDEGEKNSLSLSFIVENEADRSRAKIEEICISDGEKALDAKLNDNGALCVDGSREHTVFKGLVPQNKQYQEWTKHVLKRLDLCVDYIGPVRWGPNPFFPIEDSLDGLSGMDGKKAYAYLIKDSQKAIHPLLDSVSGWYSSVFNGWGIEVDNSRAPIYSVYMVNSKFRNNITDAGFGIQQSLPIVVSAFRDYDSPTLVVIEEPESHLNPSAHAEIGELLAIAALKNDGKRFLIETHSLNLMIRLRTLIAKGVLTRNDVAIYYVDYNEELNSSKLQVVDVDERGNVEGWPENIFNDTLNEALALRQAQITKQ